MAKRLQLRDCYRRSSDVAMLKQRKKVHIQIVPSRFVKVAPPTVHTGVGNALREAFSVDDVRCLRPFEKLLAKLN